MTEMKRILCAIDGSDQAATALEYAIDMCADSGATLHPLVVWHEPGKVRGTMGRMSVLDIDNHERASEVASAAASEAEARGVQATPHVVTGEPAPAICATAEELDVDLVVMGSRGHGAVASALLGSVSRHVTKECSRPVTVVAPVVTNPVTGQPRR